MKLRYLIPFAAAVVVALLTWSSAVSAEIDKDPGGAEAARPTYPSSVESMIERRRDQLDRRREHHQDWWTGRRWRQAPWVNARRDRMDAREDAVRESYRLRRDAMDQWHDAMGRWTNPWTQWQRDGNQARRDAHELDRLARDEYYDRFRYGPAGPWGRTY